MSTLNEEILITFDELLQLESVDISVCVDKYCALNICEKSSAPPSKIYNLWVRKLFKVYNNSEKFTTKDWQRIIEYLGKVLQEFVKNLHASDVTPYSELEQWWLDSQELLKWMETIINTLDVSILSLILIFALEIIIKTCKFANKNNFKLLCNIQQSVIILTNSFLYKITFQDVNELENFNKIVSSLCDVGGIISSADIKTSIGTWRSVAKLSEKFYDSFKNIPITKTENSMNTEKHWNEKAILGIFKELNKIVRYNDQNPCSSNDNLLQVAQFYLKLLRLIINYSKETIKTFPAIEEFLEIYKFCQQEIINKENPKMELLINKPIFDIFSLIYREEVMTEVLLQHINNGSNNFISCKLVLDYLKICMESCSKNRFNVQPDAELLLKVYNFFVEGSLIFIDKDKYTQILEHFVILTVFDSTNKMHKKLCEYVMDLSWIRAYTSMEILTIYYSYILNQQKNEAKWKCAEFWCKMWNKLNKSNETYRQHKKLTEVLLKTILNNIPNADLQQYTNNKFENMEIILLLCVKHTEDILEYFHTNLVKSLKKFQERCMNRKDYRELLNLLEVCIQRPQLIKDFLKEHILVTFTDFLTWLPASEIQRFLDFINKCFRFFCLQHNQQLNEKLLKYLMDKPHQICNMQSVFSVEFLLQQRPQSIKLLQTLKNSNKLTSVIINFIDGSPRNTQPLDLNIFRDLPLTCLQSNNQNGDLEQIKKKPRLDKGNSTNIKFILNDINTNTQQLLNFPRSTFDDNDFELMRTIRNSIEKLLTN